MGGKQKRLTAARRKALEQEMTKALVAGTFTTNGRPLDEILDEVDDGIKNDRYPIEVDLPKLIAIWSGTPAPAEAQTAAGDEQGASPAAEWTSQGGYEIVGQTGMTEDVLPGVGAGPAAVPGTVEHAQAQAAAANNGHGASPTAQAILGTGPAIGTGDAIQGGHPAYSSKEQAVIQLDAHGNRIKDASVSGEANADAVAAMAPATTEVDKPVEPEPEAPVEIDATSIADWYELAKKAEEQMKAKKDVLDQAKAVIGDFLDQQGGPDRSKVGLVNGVAVIRRVYIKRDGYTVNPTQYYKTEFK